MPEHILHTLQEKNAQVPRQSRQVWFYAAGGSYSKLPECYQFNNSSRHSEDMIGNLFLKILALDKNVGY